MQQPWSRRLRKRPRQAGSNAFSGAGSAFALGPKLIVPYRRAQTCSDVRTACFGPDVESTAPKERLGLLPGGECAHRRETTDGVRAHRAAEGVSLRRVADNGGRMTVDVSENTAPFATPQGATPDKMKSGGVVGICVHGPLESCRAVRDKLRHTYS